MNNFFAAIADKFAPDEVRAQREVQRIAAEKTELEIVAHNKCVVDENERAALEKVVRAKSLYDSKIATDLKSIMAPWLASIHSNCPDMTALEEIGNQFARAKSMEEKREQVFAELDSIASPAVQARAEFENKNAKILKKLRGLKKAETPLADTPLPKGWYCPTENGGLSPVGQAVTKFAKPAA